MPAFGHVTLDLCGSLSVKEMDNIVVCLVAGHAADKTTEILTVCLTKSLHFYHLAFIFFYKKDDILALRR